MREAYPTWRRGDDVNPSVPCLCHSFAIAPKTLTLTGFATRLRSFYQKALADGFTTSFSHTQYVSHQLTYF